MNTRFAGFWVVSPAWESTYLSRLLWVCQCAGCRFSLSINGAVHQIIVLSGSSVIMSCVVSCTCVAICSVHVHGTTCALFCSPLRSASQPAPPCAGCDALFSSNEKQKCGSDRHHPGRRALNTRFAGVWVESPACEIPVCLVYLGFALLLCGWSRAVSDVF